MIGRRRSAPGSGEAAVPSAHHAGPRPGGRSRSCILTWPRSYIRSATMGSRPRVCPRGRIGWCGGGVGMATSGRRAYSAALVEAAVPSAPERRSRQIVLSPLGIQSWPGSCIQTATVESIRMRWRDARTAWCGGVAAAGTNGRPACRTARRATAAHTAIAIGVRLLASAADSALGERPDVAVGWIISAGAVGRLRRGRPRVTPRT